MNNTIYSNEGSEISDSELEDKLLSSTLGNGWISSAA